MGLSGALLGPHCGADLPRFVGLSSGDIGCPHPHTGWDCSVRQPVLARACGKWTSRRSDGARYRPTVTIEAACAMVPILGSPTDPPSTSVLGSGFFLDDSGTVMTAGHVVDGCEPGQIYAALYKEGAYEDYAIVRHVWRSQKFDVAVLFVDPMRRAQPLQFAGDSVYLNVDVTSFEWSRSGPIHDGGQRQLSLRPTFHKGHIMRRYISTFPERTPTISFDLSCPALRGASGAAVVQESDYRVVGMIVGNVQAELQPVEVSRTEIDERIVEEVKYYLPSAKAIAWTHLRECAAEARVDFARRVEHETDSEAATAD